MTSWKCRICDRRGSSRPSISASAAARPSSAIGSPSCCPRRRGRRRPGRGPATLPHMPVRILLEVPITYDVGGETTHAPMVAARIGAATTKLILDTGSTDHVLDHRLAQRGRARSPCRASPASITPALRSRRGASATSALRDRRHARSRWPTRSPSPGRRRSSGWGVGGFLSPQHLHPDAAVSHRPRRASAPARRWRRGRRSRPGSMTGGPAWCVSTLARDAGDPTPVVAAAIEPFAPGATMLNTGGRTTEFTHGLASGACAAASRSASARASAGRMSRRRRSATGSCASATPGSPSRRCSSARRSGRGRAWSGWTSCAAPCWRRRRPRPARDVARPRRSDASARSGWYRGPVRGIQRPPRGSRVHPARLPYVPGRRRMRPATRS